ncbi:MAG: peptide chain release factor H [Bacteroidales bacterium]|nr:peptide chain release factor H [Bacteroidales bacterium]
MKTRKIIQISAGRGPNECKWVVKQLFKIFIKELILEGIEYLVLKKMMNEQNTDFSSVILELEAENLEHFLKPWLGTIQWIGQSPFRKFHKRRNWFVGISEFDCESQFIWDIADVRFETFRSKGAGGQHVNKVESAVRAIHLPTDTAVVARDFRSQHQNKKLATGRLKTILESYEQSHFQEINEEKWMEHCQLERGNPIRVYKGVDFRLHKL